MRRALYSERWAPYFFVGPFVLFFLAFYCYTTFSGVLSSFQRVQAGGNVFIGLDNYRAVFDKALLKALTNNTLYVLLAIAILVPVPMLLGIGLNSPRMRWRNFLRGSLFVPSLISVIVAGIVFRLMFGELENALINSILAKLGLPIHKWLKEGTPTAMLLLMCLTCWRWLGVTTVYYLAGLQNIPDELYEAAEVDGAGAMSKFFRITLPLLKPTIIYVLTIQIYGGYSMLTESVALWTKTTSPNNVGLTMVGQMFNKAFISGDIGQGNAVGVLLIIIIFIINIVQLNFFGLFKREDAQ